MIETYTFPCAQDDQKGLWASCFYIVFSLRDFFENFLPFCLIPFVNEWIVPIMFTYLGLFSRSCQCFIEKCMFTFF